MNKQLSAHKLLAGTLAAAIIAVAAFLLAFWHLQGKIAEFAELTRQVEGYQAMDTSLSVLQATLQDAEEQAAMIDSFYISPDGVVSFIEEVESIGRESGLTIEVEGIEAQDVDKATRDLLEKVVVRLEARGTWQNTVQFLKLVEQLPYQVAIDAANIERLDRPEGGAPIAWKTDVLLLALKLK